MGHPFSKLIPVKSGLSEGFFEKCGKQEEGIIQLTIFKNKSQIRELLPLRSEILSNLT
jgi:hypothetical protein